MPPRVSFYILSGHAPQQKELFACRLAEKAWKSQLFTHIHLSCKQDMKAMDSLLWSFRAESFLPHCPSDSEGSTEYPVTMGYTEKHLPHHNGLLINLGSTLPKQIHHFSRIAEVVTHLPDNLAQARSRFRQYREQGLDPIHNHIGPSP